MTRKLLIILLLFRIAMFGQTIHLPADAYFNKGVQAFNEGSYKLADTMFTIAIRKSPDKSAYFNRGMTRKFLKDTLGYCTDLETAKDLGHQKAKELYFKECECVTKYDIQKTSIATNPDFKKYSYYIERKIKYYNEITEEYYDKKKNLRLKKIIISPDTMFAFSKDIVPAKYKSGKKEFTKDLYSNLHYSKESAKYEEYDHVEFWGYFKINKYGKYLRKETEKEGDCTIYDVERALAGCGDWYPAKLNGKPVDYYLELHVVFDKKEKKDCIQETCKHKLK